MSHENETPQIDIQTLEDVADGIEKIPEDKERVAAIAGNLATSDLIEVPEAYIPKRVEVEHATGENSGPVQVRFGEKVS